MVWVAVVFGECHSDPRQEWNRFRRRCRRREIESPLMSYRIAVLNLIQAKHLARLEKFGSVDTSAWPAVQIRAFMTTRSKLIKQGAVKDHKITPAGQAALAAFRKQYPEHNV